MLALLVFAPVIFNIFGNLEAGQDRVTLSETISEEVVHENRTAILDFQVEDIVFGDGKTAEPGDVVYVHYIGKLESGKVFDSSIDRTEPFVGTLGIGHLITGWDLGLIGMQEGGTRRLVIPPELGYGSQEIYDDETGELFIPNNATLIFDVVLLRVEKAY